VPRVAVAALCAAMSLGVVLATAVRAAGSDPAASSPSSPSSAPSEAETLVFMHPHLASTPPGTLRYAYAEEHAGSAPVADHATLTLRRAPDGSCCAVHGDYLSGAQAMALPDIEHATSNPIVLYFLEGEVRLMQRTTNGQSAHFRRRIRQAFADEATVAPTTVSWQGRPVPAQVVHVAPYLTDPFRDRFAKDATLEYDIVVADAVPGGVWRLSATLPGSTPGAAPLARRQLTLDASTPAAPAASTR
jgi:hypothetical protein